MAHDCLGHLRRLQSYSAVFRTSGPELIEFAALGETFPVYHGSFYGFGSLLLKFPLEAGATLLSGKVRFQACSDRVCEPPQEIPFELPLNLEPFLVATKG